MRRAAGPEDPVPRARTRSSRARTRPELALDLSELMLALDLSELMLALNLSSSSSLA
jgi:hypothetical protein